MKQAIAILIGMVLVAGHAAATSSERGTRTKVTFTNTLPEPHGEATVSASLDERAERLASLEVRIDGRRIEIPRSAFADLPKPRLDFLEFRYDGVEASDPEWSVSVEIFYGDPLALPPEEWPNEERRLYSSAVIRIKGARVVGRRLFSVENGGSSRYESFEP